MQDMDQYNEYERLFKKIAIECVDNMTEADRAYFRAHPDITRYHFTYGLYIRNKYMKRFNEAKIRIHRDNMSHDVLEEIVHLLLPEYADIPESYQYLMWNGILTQLHRYKLVTECRCPVDLVKKYYHLLMDVIEYKATHDLYPAEYWTLETSAERDEYDNKHADEIHQSIEDYVAGRQDLELRFNTAIAEEYWNFSDLSSLLLKLGISENIIEDFSKRCHNGLQMDILIPSSFLYFYSCCLPESETAHTKAIHEAMVYMEEKTGEKAKVLPTWLFSRRVFVENVIKADGKLLEYAVDFSDDKDIVLSAVTKSSASIRYASIRLQHDREVIKNAVENAKYGLVLQEEIFKEYKDDDEIVRLAIECSGANIAYASERFREDFETARLAIMHNLESVLPGMAYRSLSKALRDNKELAMLMIENGSTSFSTPIEAMSDRLRDDDDIAALLWSCEAKRDLMGKMSARIQKQYFNTNE